MSTPACGEQHPETGVRCILPEAFRHGAHTDGTTSWANPEVQQAAARRTARAGSAKEAKARMAQIVAGKKPSGGFTKAEGMAAAEAAPSDFTDLFRAALREVALAHAEYSSNEVWALLAARGYTKTGSHQSVGPTMSSWAVKQGIHAPTGQTVPNTSGWGHSTDDGVKVYRSLLHRAC